MIEDDRIRAKEKKKYNKERVSNKGIEVSNNESCENKDVRIVRQQYLAEVVSTLIGGSSKVI